MEMFYRVTCYLLKHYWRRERRVVRGVCHSGKRSFQETPRSQIETVTCVSIYIMFHCDSLLWDGFVLVGSTQRYRRTYTITTKHPNETFSKQKRSEKSNRAKSCNRLNNHLETMTIQYCKFSPMNQVFLTYRQLTKYNLNKMCIKICSFDAGIEQF